MKSKAVARSLIERYLSKFGYTLKVTGFPVRGFDNFLEFIKKIGFYPKTVFDIGVGYGTPWLYEAFPKAHFVLIEPQAEFEPYLKRICGQRDAEYHLIGVGDTDGNAHIYRLPNSPTGSSFLPPSEQGKQIWGEFQRSEEPMPIVKLDTYKERNGPFLLKIDTEGFELQVIRGADAVLAKTDLVLMEVAVVERQAGEADLIDVGAVMKKHGFRLVDIPVLTQRSADGPLLYMDVAFARVGSPADTASKLR